MQNIQFITANKSNNKFFKTKRNQHYNRRQKAGEKEMSEEFCMFFNLLNIEDKLQKDWISFFF